MRALRKGLTAGLKESVEWASAAATDFRRGASGGGSGSGGAAAPPADAVDDAPWEADGECDAEEDAAAAAAHYVVEVLAASGLGARACFGALVLSDAAGGLKGRRVCTTVRAHTNDPVWNSARDLGAPCAEGDVLLLELYAPDWSRCVGGAHVAAAALREGGPPLTLPLRRLLDPRSCGGAAAAGGSGTVTLRRLRWDAAAHTAKTVFLIRHGQSRWNEAQRTRRIDAMVAFDHPLTRAGAHQATALRDRWALAAAAAGVALPGEPAAPAQPAAAAAATPLVADLLGLGIADLAGPAAPQHAPVPPPPPPPPLPPPLPPRAPLPPSGSAGALAADEDDAELAPPDARGVTAEELPWVNAFFGASFVASSPLTRALQTALLALRGHPAVSAHGVTLLRSAREIKGVGGLDSVGKATGDDILARATSALAEELPDDAAAVAAAAATRVTVNDADAEWWTAADDADGADDVAERCADLAASLQFAPPGAAILVGHSLLFRDFVRRFSCAKLAAARPDLAAKLAQGKLQNGGCLGLRLQFSRGRVRIVDAQLMFGSSIVARHDN